MGNLSPYFRKCLASALAVAMLAANANPALAQVREGECENNPFPDRNPGPGSLKLIPVPTPPDLGVYVRNRQTAVALGKALFWDMQVGGDGVQSCASCHFRAGVDPRSKNQVNPGGLDNANTQFHLGGGPNQQLTAANFPLHKLSDPTNRKSTILRSVDDVVSSQGIKLGRFLGVYPGAERDFSLPVFDQVFNIYGINTRRAEPRNTPTMINAAFNRRQFWDGRAENLFNGVNSSGVRDPQARVLKASGLNSIQQVKIRIDNASLAAQAVEPPLSDREMGHIDRNFPDLGKRLASARPLQGQRVAVDDSALASFVGGHSNVGLNTTYRAMVEAAFQPVWWQSNLIVQKANNGNISFVPKPNRSLFPNEYTMLEYNFSLFFGLAIQLYEMTLISDDAPIDRFFEGNLNALTEQQKRGLAVFTGNAACAACHSGAEFTNNSNRILLGAQGEPGEIIERMFNGQCETVIYDQSFYNIGVRPTEEDLGIGNKDKWGNPLSISELLTTPPSQIPSKELLTLSYPNIIGTTPQNPPITYGERTSTKGAFKVPGLRNVALTAPYFHNGGQATLRQVVEFYNRGGDFREHNVRFVDFEIGKLNLTPQQIDDLVAFMHALTDARVLQQKAPFDHPQLFVPNGVKMRFGIPVFGLGGAEDETLEIPAVGRNGGPAPKGFLEQ